MKIRHNIPKTKHIIQKISFNSFVGFTSLLTEHFDLCLGSADMYVAHICRERELHERVVYQLGRRRLLIMLILKKLR